MTKRVYWCPKDHEMDRTCFLRSSEGVLRRTRLDGGAGTREAQATAGTREGVPRMTSVEGKA